MTRRLQYTLALCAALAPVAGFSQSQDAPSVDAIAESTPPVAFVYLQSGTSKVYAFAAASNGKLTAVPGSPFNYAVSPQAVNGKYLFGVEANNKTVDSFLMASNGAITRKDSLNTSTYDPHACNYGGGIHVDHSGQNLYNSIVGSDCEFYEVGAAQSYKINGSTGQLQYLGTTSPDAGDGGVDGFLGNNKFAYATDFFGFDHESDCGIDTYKRGSNGALDNLGYTDMMTLSPPTSLGFTYYCVDGMATDPTNHIAVLMQQNDGSDGVYGNVQVGVYTADANGKLTTTSTENNMPNAKPIGMYDPGWMRMSPSGKFLAVSGPHGLEIFHFNGANPPTEYKYLLTNESIGALYWDNSNHLYATGPGSKLHVFTVTSSSVTEAPGSPYSVSNPGSLVVQPK